VPSGAKKLRRTFWIGPSFRIRRLDVTTSLALTIVVPDHVITEHLLRLGCRRVLFVGPKDAASTVDEREAGYREALHAAGVQFDPALTYRMDADDIESVRAVMQSGHPDGIACANDRTAGHLMHAAVAAQVPDSG